MFGGDVVQPPQDFFRGKRKGGLCVEYVDVGPRILQSGLTASGLLTTIYGFCLGPIVFPTWVHYQTCVGTCDFLVCRSNKYERVSYANIIRAMFRSPKKKSEPCFIFF